MIIVKQLLLVMEKFSNYYYTTVQLRYILNRYNCDDSFKDVTSMKNGVIVRNRTFDVCDHFKGEHVLNNTYRLYPCFILYRAINHLINDLSKSGEDSKKYKSGSEIYRLSSCIKILHSQFFYNDCFNLMHLRSTLMYQQAILRYNNKEKGASADINEVLKFNPDLIDAYLLKARISVNNNQKSEVGFVFLTSLD